jgi:hypothetical protein
MMKYRVLLFLFLVSCSTVPYVPEVGACSNELLVYHGPPHLLREVDVACEYWEKHVGPRGGMHGVAVLISEQFRGAQAYELEPGLIVIEIPLHSKQRERMIHHEVWHVMLYRTEPDLPANNESHHPRMLELGLCQPLESCGL